MKLSGSIGSALIVGGTSDIGLAIARGCASEGAIVRLAARSLEGLQVDAQDMRIRYGAEVTLHEFDILDVPQHPAFLDSVGDLPDVVICVVGLLLPQTTLSFDQVAARRVMDTNYTAPALLLAEIANRLAAGDGGTIVAVSSVAGDRGRASNYVYGSAKAGFTAFLSGLRSRFSRSGVHVVTVKPGYVATRMTEGMTLPPLLTARPDEVGAAVVAAIRKRQDVVYVPRIWRFIMTIITLLPERLFKRLKM